MEEGAYSPQEPWSIVVQAVPAFTAWLSVRQFSKSEIRIMPSGAGGLVLCGGESRRMAQPKLTLPFGKEPMLARVVRLLGEAACHVAVVAAADQTLPVLPAEVLVLRDRTPGRGPLEGIAVGLRALAPLADVVFVAACDLPLLVPGFVKRMLEMAVGYDVAVPHSGGFDEPLAAVYQTRVLPMVEMLLSEDAPGPARLMDLVRTRRVEPQELRDVDPDLVSLRNVNTPQEYRAALEAAGLRGASR